MKTKADKWSARERLLETAQRLFNAEGLRGVGVDRIIAEADVAKTTLYKHFPSKDDLILAVLRQREIEVLQMFERSIERAGVSGKGQLEAFFSALKKWFSDKHFRGCSFINAAVELADKNHPAVKYATEHKQRLREFVHQVISQDNGDAIAVAVSPAISLLIEGAITTAVLSGSSRPADVAKEAALALIRSAKSAS